MIDLQNLRNSIDTSPFSEEVKEALKKILDGAISKGSITEEEKQQCLNIIDLESKVDAADQKTNEEIAEALQVFTAGFDAAVQTASDRIDNTPPETSSEQAAAQTPVETTTVSADQNISATPVLAQPEPVAPVVPPMEVPPQPPVQ